MEWALLAGLRDDDRRALLALSHRRRFAKGEVIFHEGDPGDTLHLLAKGRVAVRLSTPMGEVTMLRVIGPGGWFGELALIAPAPRVATIVPLEPVETLVIHSEQVDELRRRIPAFDHAVANALAAEVRRLSAALLSVIFVPVDKRILGHLIELVPIYGDNYGATVIPFTQEELAQLAGTTRPTANRVLQAAANAGILAIRRGHIEILDHDLLARHAR